MKIVKWVLLAIVVLVIAGGAIVLLSIDGIIKRTVETQATDSLNLKTTLSSASLSLLGGSLKLNDLSIGSPQGFTSPQMLGLGGANLAVSYGQLRNEPIHVADITLNKPNLVIERGADGKLNFQAAMDQMP